MDTIKTKDDLYKIICNASFLGTLGLFVGSGFTKSVLEDDMDYDAYTWAELLEECCYKMNVDKSIMKSNASYPEIASKICKQRSINEETISYQEAINEMKSLIAELTTAYPLKIVQEKYSKWFEQLDLNWIVTTNYDTILESILCGKALSITPDSCFTKVKGLIPIYHIHGIRSIPSSIVITNEDYTYLFRPNDYRQARLPFLIKESLVLMIGYALGDINVVTAVDWSKNVFTNTNENYDFPIIQLLYKSDPKDAPYIDDSGIIIFEIDSLENFFKELSEYFVSYEEEYMKLVTSINDYITLFSESSDADIMRFIDDIDFRNNIIDFVASLNHEFSYIYISYLGFLRSVVKKLNELSEPKGAFEAYNKKLIVLLDILTKVPLKKMPTSFFSFVAIALDSVAHYTGTYMGQSWTAFDTWNHRKHTLPKEIVEELWTVVKSSQWNYYNDLKTLLKSI